MPLEGVSRQLDTHEAHNSVAVVIFLTLFSILKIIRRASRAVLSCLTPSSGDAHVSFLSLPLCEIEFIQTKSALFLPTVNTRRTCIPSALGARSKQLPNMLSTVKPCTDQACGEGPDTITARGPGQGTRGATHHVKAVRERNGRRAPSRPYHEKVWIRLQSNNCTSTLRLPHEGHKEERGVLKRFSCEAVLFAEVLHVQARDKAVQQLRGYSIVFTTL